MVAISQLKRRTSAEPLDPLLNSFYLIIYSLKDTNDPSLRLMEDQIINLIVTVDKSGSIRWLCPWITEECNHVVKMGYLPNRDSRLNINGFRLRFGDSAERFDLTVVEPRRFPKIRKANRCGRQAMKLCKSPNCVVPP